MVIMIYQKLFYRKLGDSGLGLGPVQVSIKSQMSKPRQFVSTKAELAHGGGYTVMPVLNGRFLDLPFHIHRLIHSYKDLCEDGDKMSKSHNKIDANLARIVYDDIMSHPLSHTQSGCLTCVVCRDRNSNSNQPSVSSLFTSLVDVPLSNPSSSTSLYQKEVPASIVESFTYQRSKPQSKDIRWINERAFIESQRKLPSSLEILLLDPTRISVLEGLTSNFCAFDSHTNSLYTAPDHLVLPGSMLRLILAACGLRNIQVIREAPELSKLGATAILDAAFVSSAIKVVSFIDKFIYQVSEDSKSTEEWKEIDFRRPMVLDELRSFLIGGLQRQDQHFLAPLIPYPLWWPLLPSSPYSKSESEKERTSTRGGDDEFNQLYDCLNLL